MYCNVNDHKGLRRHEFVQSCLRIRVSEFESMEHREPAWTNELREAFLDNICERYVLL